MKNEWICHARGAKKILKISEKYFATRKSNAIRLYPGTPFEEYRPWMSRLNLMGEVMGNDKNIPLTTSKPFPDAEYVQKFCDLYSSSASIITFGSEEPSQPYASLYREVAGALEEQQAAYEFLLNSDTWISPLANKLIVEIIPLAIGGKSYNGIGGISDPALIGTIFLGKMTDPFAKIKSVISLAHELGHQALMMLQTIENIAGKHRNALVYSGVREVERPFLHSLHAAVALVYMIEAGDMLLEQTDLSSNERSYLKQLKIDHKDALSKGFQHLAEYELSPIGNEILKDLENTVKA